MADETRGVPSQVGRTDRRRLVSRRPQSHRRRRAALALIGLSVAIIVGILLAGYVIIFVLPPRQLVVRVDDVRYTRGDMVKLLRVRQKSAEFLGTEFNAGTDVFQGLQNLVEDEIIAQSSSKLGLTMSEEEVDAQIRGIMLPSLPLLAGKSQDQIERELKERYKSYLNSVQLSEHEHRQLVRRTALRERMRQFVGEKVPGVAEQVHLHRIAMVAEDEVDIMLINLEDAVGNNSDPEHIARAFKEVAREFSRDNAELVRLGGDLGWVPRGIYEDYDNRIFDLELGVVSEPIPNIDDPKQMFFFMVSERDVAREVDPGNLNTLKTRALQDWVNGERENHDIYAVFNSEIYDWVLKQLRLTARATPTPDPNANPFPF